MHPRVLIIATTPYSESDSSRSLDAYFHYWEKENVAQIFCRNWLPNKGHCGELYQITDSSLLRRWLHKQNEVGQIYKCEDLVYGKENNQISDSSAIDYIYKIGTKHTPFIELLRGALWRKKYWRTSQLDKWLDCFKPECILYNFSNHLFTQPIALYVAERFQIPIVAIIGDDYYFNDRFSLSPAYQLFRWKFKWLTRKILSGNCGAIYCSDKIRDKYNAEFGIHGETVYLTSSIERRKFRPIRKENPVIVYFGSIRLGRNLALIDIANALARIRADYKLEVYSNETDETIYASLKNHQNVIYGGSIPYSEVKRRTSDCDIFIVAEGFRKEDIDFTRYSLSTKAADALACGSAVFTYGPEDAGVVGYLQSTNASKVCTNRDSLEHDLKELITNVEEQQALYRKAIIASETNHSLIASGKTFERVLRSVLSRRNGD